MEERIPEGCAASDWQAGLCGNKNSDSSWRRDSGCVAGGDSGNLWKLSCMLSTGEGRKHCRRACPNACRYSIALQPGRGFLCLTWRNLRDFGALPDMAFGIPLVVYYFCMILKERYFPDALWLYPPQWISGAARWGERGEGLWLFLLLMLAVLMGGHAATIYGKIEAG